MTVSQHKYWCFSGFFDAIFNKHFYLVLKANRLCVRLISQLTKSQQSLQTLPQESSLDLKNAEIISEKALQESLENADYFGVHKLFTVEKLFECRVHLGHKEGTLNEHMTPYIFGSRLGHLIFDLDQTAARLREALNFTAHIAFRGGVILFLNRSRHVNKCIWIHSFESLINHQTFNFWQTVHMVERTAKECGEYAHCRQWQMGTFTDSQNYYQAVTRLPDLMLFFSTLYNSFEMHPAVKDAAKLLIPSVGIVDTNCDPTLVTFPVPGNDDTYFAIKLYCQLFKQAILLGKEKRKIVLQRENALAV